jgi:osmoprotectant transport system permease protein
VVDSLIADAGAIYDYVDEAFRAQYGIEWLDPLGFNNTYALMVPREVAEEKGWRRVSDLPK